MKKAEMINQRKPTYKNISLFFGVDRNTVARWAKTRTLVYEAMREYFIKHQEKINGKK